MMTWKGREFSSSFREENDGRPSEVELAKNNYVDDDHLYVADDEDSVFVGLRGVDVAICDGDGPSPAAVNFLALRNDKNLTITNPAAAIDAR